ncbi:MAG: AmmeMemoRadiSam system protein B [Bryobacteraceae bacterium]|jgi:AmmeMemoRadiSam system protein B/AmmeMemoRadiSam system protein A
MKKHQVNRAIALVLLLSAAACGQKTRQPAVAGAFYPADANELRNMVDGFLAQAAPPAVAGPVVALISPHAGYQFSGAVAAYSYALLKGRKPERVVVIAPSHIEAFGFSAVYDGDAYATPLGTVPVDKAFAAKLASMSPLIKLSSQGHVASGGQGEHALEVQLPFLQRVLGQFKLVPIIMGDQSYDACRALGVALAKLIQGSDTLIVASSDLSHFHPYDEAVKIDHKTLKAIQEWDYLSMSRNFESRVWEACGGGPIVAAMIASERLGATEAVLLKYANSGDVTGDHSRVVGYGALALVKAAGGQASAAPPFSLTQAERDELLKLARTSVETAVRQHRAYDFKGSNSEALMQERGAFVTLKKNGELRGCIGYVAPVKPLSLTVRDVATYAALRDSRFSPVEPSELSQLQYEVSVLSPLRRVLDIKQIEVGKDGLVMRRGENEGLLLPQVPVEQHWNRATFLAETCRKAGLPADAWKDEQTDIFMFTALVFGDHTPAAGPPARH